jgi:hypothetical protein
LSNPFPTRAYAFGQLALREPHGASAVADEQADFAGGANEHVPSSANDRWHYVGCQRSLSMVYAAGRSQVPFTPSFANSLEREALMAQLRLIVRQFAAMTRESVSVDCLAPVSQ